ncbi:MAG: hypothetical protein PVG65_06680 [Candidatus Thorarchaeota archaeon]|jgi:hypothetical protein
MARIINYTTKCKLKKIVKSSAVSKLKKLYPNANIGVDPIYKKFYVKTPDGDKIFEIEMGSYDKFFEIDIDEEHPSNLVSQIYTFLLLGCPVTLSNRITTSEISPRELVIHVARKFDKIGHKVKKSIMKKAFEVFFSSK